MNARGTSHEEGSRHVVIGVTGGIAAYKACTLVRLLVKAGLDVTVVPTRAALEMVGRTTWEALTGRSVAVEATEGAADVTHVRIGQQADLVMVAPATANTMAKIRAGIADNLLTCAILVATCPVVIAPAMHTEMWLNAATQDNVAALRARGVDVLDPAVGRLTGPDSGPGRMLEPEELAGVVLQRLGLGEGPEASEPTAPAAGDADWSGRHVLVSAGGTHEAIDPVRYIGNNSSGVFGAEIACEAVRRGARVTLVAANVHPATAEVARGAEVINVVSAAQLRKAMLDAASSADVVIMSAAVADFRPVDEHSTKQKKSGEGERVLRLVENPDILAEIAHRRGRDGQIVVGFAAETGDESGSVLEYGRRKAARKGADFMVINEVGTARGFGDVPTSITMIDHAGRVHATGTGSKPQLARVILDTIFTRRPTH